MKPPRRIPVQRYMLGRRLITVCRADLVPRPPLAPYLKMIELQPFLELVAKKGIKVVGYYAVPESEWVTALPLLASPLGMTAFVGISQTKVLPSYLAEIPSANVLYFRPNLYRVNFARMRKAIEAKRGLMIPMGLECPEVVNGLTAYLEDNPLPIADCYVVPVGSGVALAGISNHLPEQCKIVGVCTRPVESVRQVVRKYTQREISLIHREPGKREHGLFPMHRYWDQNAFDWLVENVDSLSGTICFINLGSGRGIQSSTD